MSNSHQYIALICSLPHLGLLFSRADVPISAFRLKQRLAVLAPDHARLLRDMIAVTDWAGVARCNEDSEVLARANKVVADLADYPDLQHLAGTRMETRTIIAALRRRRDGQETPGDIRGWGFGRWCTQISNNWSDPGFGLSHFMPWVPEAHQLMAAGDHIAMERLALTEVFRQLDHYGHTHQFDFEAVGIYVLRWVIVERWSRYNVEDARRRLGILVDAALNPSNPAPPFPLARPEPFLGQPAIFEETAL